MSAAPAGLEDAIRGWAAEAGFDAVGFAPASVAARDTAALDAFLAGGFHGSMGWMADTAARRAAPRAMWAAARSAIVLGMNYGPDRDPLAVLDRRDRAAISVYAQGPRDYHDVVKKALKRVARALHARTGAEVKVFVDTAPLLERALAAAAGIGVQGKHTNLYSRDFGNWLFLGSILTTLELTPSRPDAAAAKAAEAAADPADPAPHCGSCRKCLDACPTDAFPEPFRLDARRCISYLTIEHSGPIPEEFRTAMGNRVYGCDDCLAVCPWNKFAREAREAKLQARDDLRAPPLAELLALDDAAFRARFAGSPIKRTGRDRFVRNCLIAAGNSGDAALTAPVRALLDDPDPVVREAAAWAATRLPLAPPDAAAQAPTEDPGEGVQTP